MLGHRREMRSVEDGGDDAWSPQKTSSQPDRANDVAHVTMMITDLPVKNSTELISATDEAAAGLILRQVQS